MRWTFRACFASSSSHVAFLLFELRLKGGHPQSPAGSSTPRAHAQRRSHTYMGFDQNFRILRSIVPDPQDPQKEITTDFKVPISLIPELSVYRYLPSIFNALRYCGCWLVRKVKRPRITIRKMESYCFLWFEGWDRFLSEETVLKTWVTSSDGSRGIGGTIWLDLQ